VSGSGVKTSGLSKASKLLISVMTSAGEFEIELKYILEQ